MPTFKEVLVGLTLDPESKAVTDASRRAALQARWVAERTGARITLYHSSWDDPRSQMVVGGTLLMGGTSPAVVQAIEPLAEEVRSAGVEAKVVSDAERPWLGMTRRVVKGWHDLVVVAKRHAIVAEERRLGTNTHKLLRKCPVPVWVVNPDHDLLHRSVLVATDLSEVGERAVRLGAFLAGSLGCELNLVHVLWEHAYADETRARESMQAALDAAPTKAEARLHVEEGKTSTVLLEAVERLDPDLVVLGTVSRSGVPGLLVGNTAEKLIQRLDTSMLTVKPEGFHSPVEAD